MSWHNEIGFGLYRSGVLLPSCSMFRGNGSSGMDDAARELYPVAYQAAKRSVPTLSHEDWEDAASESVLVVCQRMEKESVKSPKALVASVSANKAKDALRKITSEKRGSGNIYSVDAEDFQEPVGEGVAFVVNIELAEAVELALNSLTEEDRSFALDALNHKLPYRDLAAKYGLSEGRVGSRLHSIRAKMKPYLEDFLKDF